MTTPSSQERKVTETTINKIGCMSSHTDLDYQWCCSEKVEEVVRGIPIKWEVLEWIPPLSRLGPD